MRVLVAFAAALMLAVPAAAADLKPWTGGATPPLALRDLDGREHRLEDHRGKVVVVNFWATWCEPCVREMPSLERLQARMGGRVAVLAVNFAEGEPRIRDFLAKHPAALTVLLDRDMGTAKAWKARVLPTTFIVDPAGRVRYVALGEIDTDAPAFDAALRRLIK